MLGERWKNLSDTDRRPYDERAAADKKRYEEEKAAYNVCDRKRPLPLPVPPCLTDEQSSADLQITGQQRARRRGRIVLDHSHLLRVSGYLDRSAFLCHFPNQLSGLCSFLLCLFLFPMSLLFLHV